MIKGIVFDKDGTLLSIPEYWYPVAHHATELIYSDFGAAPDDIDDHLADVGIFPSDVDISLALPRGDYAGIVESLYNHITKQGLPCEINALVRSFTDSYAKKETKACGGIVPICDNIRDVLSHLRDMGIILAVITSDDVPGAKYCLDRLGIADLFDMILAYDGITPAKPAPNFMEMFRERFSIGADEVIMVGDTETDILFAGNSGVKSIGVAKNEKNRNLLISYGADTVIYDITYVKDHLN
ncbi:MAG: HAD family hydrolase [Clostridia bacterium]|nr:HAD family hydrolase [Clostridia bacterium]